MTPIDLPPRKYGHLSHNMFGWYVKADMADDQVVEWWSEALEANHNKERQLKLAHVILDRCPEHIGALTIVGYCCDSLPERLVILRQAVLIGTRVWAKALSGDIEVRWWEELGTRNYASDCRLRGRAARSWSSCPCRSLLCYIQLDEVRRSHRAVRRHFTRR